MCTLPEWAFLRQIASTKFSIREFLDAPMKSSLLQLINERFDTIGQALPCECRPQGQ